ncbi:MAG: EAL domain-containing protein [Cyanobacteria bacterium RM1_2_2]|nr:EAL domain-containing protein [Cyanobacteria bacterium RM1_2_2]
MKTSLQQQESNDVSQRQNWLKWHWQQGLVLMVAVLIGGSLWHLRVADCPLLVAVPILWLSLTGASLLVVYLLMLVQALRRTETRYLLMMQGFNGSVWDWDLKTNRVYFSPRWKQMLGDSKADFSNRPQEWFDRVHPLDRSALEAALSDYLQGSATPFEHEYRLRHEDGGYRWMQSRAIATYSAKGQPERLVGSQIDITAQKQAEEELWRSTFFDRLTDLPSWAGFTHHLQQAMNQAQQDAQFRFAILWLDLDQFKLINNSLGSRMGDQLLVAIAERLSAFLLPNEVIARLGEDEFAILLKHIQDSDEAIRMAQQIQQKLACPFHLDDQEIFVTASIGIALNAPHYHNSEYLLRDAGTAMYRAKAMGRASYLVFDKSMRTGMLVKLRLESDLRRAIAEGERQSQAAIARQADIQQTNIQQTNLQQTNLQQADIGQADIEQADIEQPDVNAALRTAPLKASQKTSQPNLIETAEQYPQLELYYQPIVRLTTGQVTGFEALVRWQHAEQGLLFPSRFISMAEETGLIIPLSWWILRTACRQMSQWQAMFPQNTALTMSVNLSSKQFSMPGLTKQILQILQESGLEPAHLKLELTESMVMENMASVIDVLYQLQSLGIRLAIDDFGTGYSSLSYLPRFPITTLKIDRSFVDRISDCNNNLEIVRTILSLAHSLRLDVVAEGVETKAQAIRLHEMGCEYGQGFFFYKPMNASAATDLLVQQGV